jgi:NADP oxidoreductase coenzyme F420-dependent
MRSRLARDADRIGYQAWPRLAPTGAKTGNGVRPRRSSGRVKRVKANELGELASATSVERAIKGADVVVFAVWLDTLKDLIARHADLLRGKVVVDPSNPIAPESTLGVGIIGVSPVRGYTAHPPIVGDVLNDISPRYPHSDRDGGGRPTDTRTSTIPARPGVPAWP